MITKENVITISGFHHLIVFQETKTGQARINLYTPIAIYTL